MKRRIHVTYLAQDKIVFQPTLASAPISRQCILVVHHNFARIHQTLWGASAMATGIGDRVWSIEEIASLLKKASLNFVDTVSRKRNIPPIVKNGAPKTWRNATILLVAIEANRIEMLKEFEKVMHQKKAPKKIRSRKVKKS